MTIITVTTVGYREVHQLSRAGRGVHRRRCCLGGVGAALYTFTLLATRRRRRRPAQAPAAAAAANVCSRHIKDHFIICGYGRIGSIVAQQFRRQNDARSSSSSAIRSGCRRRSRTARSRVEADASREDVLKRVGIDRARGLIAAVGTDAENVYAVLSARVMRPDLFIVGRAETEDATIKLKRAGADRVISPYQIGAVQIAQTALRPAVVDFVELATSSDNLELAMEEITIGAAVGARRAGRSSTANLRQRFGVIVVGIQRQDRPDGVQPRARHARCAPATSWSCSAGPKSLEAASELRRGRRRAKTLMAGARARRHRRRRTQIRAEVGARRSPRSRRAPGGRPGSASCSSATIPASEIYVAEQAEVGGRGRAARRSRAAAGDGVARASCSRWSSG